MFSGSDDHGEGAARDAETKPAPITIKKYANRRLYNTATSSYVTLDTLCGMVKRGEDFVVYDAKTGEDITRSVLTQIIFEEEAKGENLLPINFLRQLIQFYGHGMQGFVPGYLEMSLRAFAQNQEKMREQMGRAFGGGAAMEAMESMTRKNMEWFENAMRMFTPFAGPGAPGGHAPGEPRATPGSEGGTRDSEIEELRSQMERMRAALDAIEKKR